MFVVFVSTIVTVNSHIYIFFPKSREKAFKIFRAGLYEQSNCVFYCSYYIQAVPTGKYKIKFYPSIMTIPADV